MRACLTCGVVRGRDGYNDHQWVANGRMAKCRSCVLGLDAAERAQRQEPSSSALHGPSILCEDGGAVAVDLEGPAVQSSHHRSLARGMYISSRQPCVVKWYRAGLRAFESDGALPGACHRPPVVRSLISTDMRIIQRAVALVAAWNAATLEAEAAAVQVQVSVPQVAQCISEDGRRRTCWQTQEEGPSERSARDGHQVLVEPWLPNYTKWTSNTGYTAPSCPAWAPALSHFTWVASGGEALLCNLKGSELPGERSAVLSDPTIHSRARCYGPTDLGPDGVRSFFSRHTCNEICRRWPKPRDSTATLPVLQRTVASREAALPPSVISPEL